VDADCIASPNLCSTIAAEIGGGAHAVQVPYEVSNSSESPTAGLRAAGFALKHVIRARGRARLGLSCNLFGTGMGFSATLLHRVPWPQSVTEDTELFVRLTRAGYHVAYAETARVTSPMPASADQAAQQQLRWESGNAQLVRHQLPGLLWQTLSTGDVQGAGAAAELAVPSQTLMAAGGLLLLGGGLLASDRRLVASSAATIAAQATYVLGGLASAGGAGLILDPIVHVPAFAAARLRVLGRVATGRGARTWVRTTRAGVGGSGSRP
jgi:1,2-diacylglycerol 3-beta-glucosyltransferase